MGKSTFNPLARVQFGQGALQEFSQSLLLTNAFEDDDEDDYEDACRTVPSRKGRFA